MASMDKRTASSLPFRFAAAVFVLVCVVVVSLERHLRCLRRGYPPDTAQLFNYNKDDYA